jgi:antitoxin component YwqK of YwqJK toxin-antitoxin module
MHREILFILFLMLGLSCKNLENDTKARSLTHKLNLYLGKEAEHGDSSVCQNYKSGRISRFQVFCKSQLIFEESKLETGEPVALVHCSRDGLFELRNEYFKSGEKKFIGIYYKEKGCGLSSTWDSSKLLISEGTLFNGIKIGHWKIRDSNGVLKDTNYGNLELYDSLEALRKFIK